MAIKKMKIFCEQMAQPFEELKILTRNNETEQLNWTSAVKALYEHCISTEISELNLFVDRNIVR